MWWDLFPCTKKLWFFFSFYHAFYGVRVTPHSKSQGTFVVLCIDNRDGGVPRVGPDHTFLYGCDGMCNDWCTINLSQFSSCVAYVTTDSATVTVHPLLGFKHCSSSLRTFLIFKNFFSSKWSFSTHTYHRLRCCRLFLHKNPSWYSHCRSSYSLECGHM